MSHQRNQSRLWLGLALVLVVAAAGLMLLNQQITDQAKAYATLAAQSTAVAHQAATATAAQGQALDSAATAVAAAATTERQAAETNSLMLLAEARTITRDDPFLAYGLAIQAASLPNPPPAVVADLRALTYDYSAQRQFKGHTKPVRSIALSPDGKMAVSGSDDNTAILWDTITGKQIQTFVMNNAVKCAAFSPDGKTVLAGTSYSSYAATVNLWDIDTGKLIHQFVGHELSVTGVAFSPDGKTFISSSDDKTLNLWDVNTGDVIRTFVGHQKAVTSVAFDPDGRAVLSGSADNNVILWNVSTGQIMRTMTGHQSPVTSVAFSPADDRIVVSASTDNTLIVWNVTYGKAGRSYAGGLGAATSVTFSPDGRSILSGSSDNTLVLRDTMTGAILHIFSGHHAAVNSVAFSPDGKTVLSGSDDNTLIAWDLSGPQLIHSFINPELARAYDIIHEVRFSPDGKTALVESGRDPVRLALWDLNTATTLFNFPVYNAEPIAFSPDGKTFVSVRETRRYSLADTKTGDVIRDLHIKALPNKAIFSPDGKTIALILENYTFVLVDVQSGDVIREFTGSRSQLVNIDFNPDGKTILSAGVVGDNYATRFTLWDVNTGDIIYQLKGGKYDTNIDFSPDGKTFLSGGIDTEITLWNASTGDIIRTFTDPILLPSTLHDSDDSSAVISQFHKLVFNPDGQSFLAILGGTTAAMVDIHTGKMLASFNHHGALKAIAIAPDGKTILSGGYGKSAYLWRILSADELINWLSANRTIRQPNCEERLIYQVEPLCDAIGLTPTPTP